MYVSFANYKKKTKFTANAALGFDDFFLGGKGGFVVRFDASKGIRQCILFFTLSYVLKNHRWGEKDMIDLVRKNPDKMSNVDSNPTF